MRELREIPGEDRDWPSECEHGDESQCCSDHHPGEGEAETCPDSNSGQEIDKHWRVVTETSIKAKSVRGYSTYSRKLTENKWKAGTEKPELVEDWDQRLLVTTLARKEDGNILELSQIAEKDQVLVNNGMFYNNEMGFLEVLS